MSKERDLLQRAKILLDCVCTSPVQKEIEELLAQPEPEQTEQEPVAWMYDWKIPTGEVQHVCIFRFTKKVYWHEVRNRDRM